MATRRKGRLVKGFPGYRWSSDSPSWLVRSCFYHGGEMPFPWREFGPRPSMFVPNRWVSICLPPRGRVSRELKSLSPGSRCLVAGLVASCVYPYKESAQTTSRLQREKKKTVASRLCVCGGQKWLPTDNVEGSMNGMLRRGQ